MPEIEKLQIISIKRTKVGSFIGLFMVFTLRNLEMKMEELARRGSMFLTNQSGRGSILMDANRRRTISRQNEGLVHPFFLNLLNSPT